MRGQVQFTFPNCCWRVARWPSLPASAQTHPRIVSSTSMFAEYSCSCTNGIFCSWGWAPHRSSLLVSDAISLICRKKGNIRFQCESRSMDKIGTHRCNSFRSLSKRTSSARCFFFTTLISAVIPLAFSFCFCNSSQTICPLKRSMSDFSRNFSSAAKCSVFWVSVWINCSHCKYSEKNIIFWKKTQN